MTDTKRKDELVEEILELRAALREVAVDLSHSKAQRDGLRNLLGSVYRRLRDGRDASPSQMEALRICYDRRRTLDALLPETEDEPGRRENALVERAREAGL